MRCPTQYWHQADGDRRNKLRRWLRRLAPWLLSSLAAASCMGPGMIPPGFFQPEDRAQRRPASGPPPGHPEQLAGGWPLTTAERELWESLEPIDWW